MAGHTYIFGSVLLICLSLPWIVEMSEVVSIDRPTTQSSNYMPMGTPIYLSGNAVDGNTNQRLTENSCAHQAEGEKEVWWRVDLQREVFIDNVKIYYRDEGSHWSGWKNRFAGYEVYLSNTTERHREERCFIDVTQDFYYIRSVVDHSECTGTARYVTIYNNRETPKRRTWYSEDAYLELCEVNVYGCEAGRYGNGNCNNNCSSNCPGSLCHPGSGYCLYCGYNTYRRYPETFCRPCPESCAGPCDRRGRCTTCQDGFYGNKCDRVCPTNCRVCNRRGDYCTACQDGFYGNKCDRVCPTSCGSRVCDKNYGYCTVCNNGYYGLTCTKCSENCVSGACDFSGRCTGGCDNGYYGNKCEQQCPQNCIRCIQDGGQCQECKEGFYGYWCRSNCPTTCGSPVCEKAFGRCTECPIGKYGSRCHLDCRFTCRNNICDINHGTCSACNNGYYGLTCTKCPENCVSGACDFSGRCTGGCDNGYYGNKCEQQCPQNCMKCIQDGGQCEACNDGYYGPTCTECPENCVSGACDFSGHCKEGCDNGYYGNKCEQQCPQNCIRCIQDGGQCEACNDGYYGPTCTKCPENCVSGACDFSGHCTEGCDNGYYGNKCEQQCPQNCMNCIQDGGQCEAEGCDNGYYGNKCEQQCPQNCIRCIQDGGQCEACKEGYYGPTCTECPENCVSGTCDFSGRCTDGCVDDIYYGTLCEQPCPVNCTSCAQDRGQCSACNDGNYGTFCERACGYCEGERCDKTTGDCAPCQTDWTGKRCDVRVDRQLGGEESNVAQSAGIGAGVVVAVIIIVVIIVFMIKRRTSTSKESTVRYDNVHTVNSSGMQPPDEARGCVYVNLENETIKENNDEREQVYYNECPIGFPVGQLKAMIAEKMADEEKQFISEFETFPVGAIHPHKIAQKNISKNRFKSIYPYDHSRVILNTLPGEKGSDYINANFIDSVETRKVYVATQGPISSTIDDFWRMMWTLRSGKIVMLTNLLEGRKQKCEKYWPEEGKPMSTKKFNITLDRERDYASHVVRNITLVDRKSKEKRKILQFHFTAWPDHGTPNTLELVLFHRRLTLHRTDLPGQMVVHCSAGIGRTGTFIALDALLDFGKRENRIDIQQFVNTMRKDRMNMIQTVDQYVALHEILAEAFDLQDTLIPMSTFVDKYHALLDQGKPQNKTKLRDEFKLMLDLKPEYKLEDCFTAALLDANKEKNKTIEILAADRFRAFLESYTSDSNDYINAVITQSYIDQKGYIVTQFPLQNTIADFWTLVIDYESDTIVILGDERDSRQGTQWIPAVKGSITFAEFNLKQKGTPTEISGVDVIDVIINRTKENTEHSVRIFQVKDWTKEMQVPPSKQSILHLLERVESRRRSCGKPVVVTCMDGATQCGLFCLMANTRDQVKMDEEVDVFQAARQLLIRRPQFLRSFDQYLFCYAILNDYLEATDVYRN